MEGKFLIIAHDALRGREKEIRAKMAENWFNIDIETVPIRFDKFCPDGQAYLFDANYVPLLGGDLDGR